MKEIAKRTIRACVGNESSYRARTLSSCFYLANYGSLKKPFDVVFYSGSRQWPTIKLVVEELIRRRGDLRLGLVSPWLKKEIVRDIPIFRTITIPVIDLFDTQILYTTGMWPFEARQIKMRGKARVVYSVTTMTTMVTWNADDFFNAYDYILCAGSHHVDSLRKSFRKDTLRYPASGNWLLPAGYPKLDLMLISHSTKRRAADPSVNSTIVYAPNHTLNEGLTSLRPHGEAIVNALLAAGHRVIFRPHPVSFGDSDRPVIDHICRLHADNPNFSLDASADYTESYSLADLMVTDVSGTGFTFSFSFGRPCLFFAPGAQAERGLSGIQFDARHRIGAAVRDIDELIGKTAELCHRDMTEEIARFRDETVFNVGKSAAYIVDCLEDILSGRQRPEWVRL